MVRTKARENAFLLLFQESFSKSQDSSEILDVNSEIGEIQVDDYCKKLFNGVVSHKDEIDSVIEKKSSFKGRAYRYQNRFIRNVLLR